MNAGDTKMIKSARRVFEVLEFLGTGPGGATVMDIARALDYPQSSTSELLKCLVTLGYLSYDPYARTYQPSARVALLGAWVQPTLFRQGHLLPMLDDLHDCTGELIALATASKLTVQYIHVLQATNPVRTLVPQGTERPILKTATGKLFLSTMDETKVKGIVHRLNAEGDAEDRVSFTDLSAELRQIRQQGYAVSVGGVNPGWGMVAMLLPQRDAGQRLAVGIGSSSALIEERREDYVAALKAAIHRHVNVPIHQSFNQVQAQRQAMAA